MKITPSVFAIALATALGGLTPLVASAQPPSGERPGFDVEQRLSELTQRVGLDAAQVVAARAILTDARAELMQARAASERGGPAMPDVRRAILFRVEDRLWAILTCPQKDAFRLYVRERMVEHMERRGGMGPSHGPPPGRRPGRR